MVSVDLIAMVTSEASEGYERRLRAKRVIVTSEGYERSELWLRAKRVMVVFNDTPMEEVSGVFFLTAHFVIPVISLLWRKVLECSSSLLTSSSLCPHSLRHPCVLTPMTCLLTHLIVIPDFSLESSHPSHP